MKKIMKLGRLAIISAVAVSCVSIGSVSASKEDGPFAGISGNWKGVGKITPPGGKAENISCKVNYSVAGGGNKATQTIKCSGGGYWVNASSDFKFTPGNKKIDGSWKASYGAKADEKKDRSGTISGDFIDNTITITLSGESSPVNMNINVENAIQKVEIQGFASLELKR